MSALGSMSSLWSTLATMGAVAILFMLFCLLKLRSETSCADSAEGQGCGSCSAVCHLHPDPRQRGGNDHA